MSNARTEEFVLLLQDTRRDDDYINGNKWCKYFEFNFEKWKTLPGTKASLIDFSNRNFGNRKIRVSNSESEEIQNLTPPKIRVSNPEGEKIQNLTPPKIRVSNPEGEKISPWVVERVGKTWVTWLHPFMAVQLAKYLNPDFANYVANVFIRYITADPHLAADIASRQQTTEGLDIINKVVQERYDFLKGKLNRNYYIIRDAWGDKLYYDTRTKEIQLDGSPLDLEFLRLNLALELHIDIGSESAEKIVKELAIVNTYPSMDEVNQQKFALQYHWGIKRFNFVPTEDCPTPPIKLS